MNYAVGCAFSMDNLFENFPYKKLDLTCKKVSTIIKENHRDLLVKKIFRDFLKILFLDIVENNITFWLPLSGKVKSNIHMRRVEGKSFKKLRQAGKWKEIDIFKSNFCAYQMSLYLLGQRTPRVKNVYLNKFYRDIITKKTNEGFPYGDGKTDKYVKDYYEEIYKLFPTVTKRDIKRILNFGLRSLYLHNSYGGDVKVKEGSFWLYIGNLRKKPLDHFFYYIKKLTIRLRVLHKRRKLWDGYYYFGLSEKSYEKYLNQIKTRGRPRKYFHFGPVFLYQILDECKINERFSKYIFKVPYMGNMGMKRFSRNFVSDKAQLIIKRELPKFKDICVFTNKYNAL